MFTGGCDREAVAVVCAADDLPGGEILDLMSRLVDQSVVLAEEAAAGYTRYRMLTDVRQFGLERADGDGELDDLQARHAIWFAALASRFDDEACGPDQPDWLRRLRLEHANLRAAIAFIAGATEGVSAGLVMARELDLFWSASGLLDEARHWLETGLASGVGTPKERAIAMAVAARFAVLQNDRLRAGELVDEGERRGKAGRRRPCARLQLPVPDRRVGHATPTGG